MLGLFPQFFLPQLSRLPKVLLLSVLGSASLIACAPADKPDASSVKPTLVMTQAISQQQQSELDLTGVVKARAEIPVAFQVSGRIAKRLVEAGQLVKKGQVLYRLDPKDLTEALKVAEAGQAAAQASLDTASAELKRAQELLKKGFISAQGSEQAQLKFNEAKANLAKATAQRQQAQHALSYAVLKASVDGVITEIYAEPGQVVSQGQRLAALATVQELEVEIQLPEQLPPPERASIQLPQGEIALTLRTAAGSADVTSLTRLSRYQITTSATNQLLRLGQVLSVKLHLATQAGEVQIPIAALDERGKQPQVWQVLAGKAQPVAVEVLALNTETAVVKTSLPHGTPIIVLGTHLLSAGMAVQELKP